ncbi:APC family permease [Mycolicibacterium aromaticivorans]|uniref:APC family permease n=1 Tax=Mycolicibacterium aromaticivorans TaxID=318425 RepID=UPI0026A379D6
MSQNASPPRSHLSRSLGLWAVVGLGLGYMTPMTVFDTFGIVSGETNGVVPLAYIVALVAMVFTAISYGRMTRVYPSAGSAYTYASETIHPNFGFVVGWSSLLDYLLLPMVNAVIARIYFESFFPSAPSWVFVLGYVAAITALNYLSMKGTSRVNGILVVFQVVLIGAFLVLAAMALSKGVGAGTIFTLDPLAHEGVQMQAVVAGATVVCFSFIGFDAITMYAEEAKSPDIVPRAIVLALLIGGAIFFAAAWFSQSVFPTLDGFEVTDDTLPEMALKVGGMVFKVFFVSAALAAVVASSLASHASVARMIYVMGRNGRGRFGRFLSYIHPRFLTPAHAVLIVGVVSLLAVKFTLEFASSMINFGALIAFTVVNLTIIVLFAFRLKRRRTPKEIATNIVLPAIGMALTGALWVNLHFDALLYGGIWLAIGIAVLVYLTKGFRDQLTMRIEDETLTEEGTPVPDFKH